ncbi:hypothetical protein AVEN_233620-1 [Araneus ventricosus]|uniref:Uncharacterized protein n=1 Tax=Araneus ventricosus TaxID=182803 RepID=A0A4Y2FYI2_ARAVE|nr:hypothetical protein AVEN_233620-1 [Araneus ventricosus]
MHDANSYDTRTDDLQESTHSDQVSNSRDWTCETDNRKQSYPRPGQLKNGRHDSLDAEVGFLIAITGYGPTLPKEVRFVIEVGKTQPTQLICPLEKREPAYLSGDFSSTHVGLPVGNETDNVKTCVSQAGSTKNAQYTIAALNGILLQFSFC